MKITIKGTQTEKNIMKAFATKTQSHCRYKFYAKAAKKDGYPRCAARRRTSFRAPANVWMNVPAGQGK
jgi:rubrerythrin